MAPVLIGLICLGMAGASSSKETVPPKEAPPLKDAVSQKETPSQNEIVLHLNQLRGIKPRKRQAENDLINQRLDAAWRYLSAHLPAAVPVIEGELRKEIEKPEPDNFFLLDAGFFLVREAGRTDESVSSALARIDPESEVIWANFRQFFDYTYALAKAGDKKALAVIDRAFLPGERHLFVPQHSLDLDPTLVCVFLYGVYGPAIENHLWDAGRARPDRIDRVLEILNWIGTPDSVGRVTTLLQTSPGYDTLVRAVGFLMRLGGEKGREAILGIDRSSLDRKGRSYLDDVRHDLKKQSYKEMVEALDRLGRWIPKLSDQEVKKRLEAMYKNYGEDDLTYPGDIIHSGLPPDYLVGQLIKIRTRALFRLSDEALDTVEKTNAMINILTYPAPPPAATAP